MHNDSHSTPKPSHEEWLPKSRCSTAPTSKIAPPQAPIIHFQLWSPICITVYRYALTVFGQGGQSNCYNDIAFAKKGQANRVERKRKWGERGESERGAAATHREPLRTHSMSGLALSRRHQGHCNEIQRGEREEGKDKENKSQQTEVSVGEEWRPLDMSDFSYWPKKSKNIQM